jgi:hypothetical protein
LKKNLKERLTAQQARDHPFFKKHEDELNTSVQSIDADVLTALRGNAASSQLKKAALNLLVKHLEPS